MLKSGALRSNSKSNPLTLPAFRELYLVLTLKYQISSYGSLAYPNLKIECAANKGTGPIDPLIAPRVETSIYIYAYIPPLRSIAETFYIQVAT